MKVLYCEKAYFQSYEDYINTFLEQLNIKLRIVDNLDKVDYNITDTYYFLARLPQCIFFNRSIKAIYINMEQLSRNCHLVYCQTINSFNIPIINYNEGNCYLLPGSHLLRLQLQSSPYDSSTVTPFFIPSQKLYDVAFVGSICSRRMEIITKIRNNGYKVNIVTGWKEERDKEILKAKVLLNIHYAEDYNIYESLRCDRFLFSDTIVVTEKSYLQESLDINDLLIVSDYSNLASKVTDVLENYTTYMKDLKHKLEGNIIIQERKKDLDSIEVLFS
jgi:hypothetical protein